MLSDWERVEILTWEITLVFKRYVVGVVFLLVVGNASTYPEKELMKIRR